MTSADSEASATSADSAASEASADSEASAVDLSKDFSTKFKKHTADPSYGFCS